MHGSALELHRLLRTQMSMSQAAESATPLDQQATPPKVRGGPGNTQWPACQRPHLRQPSGRAWYVAAASWSPLGFGTPPQRALPGRRTRRSRSGIVGQVVGWVRVGATACVRPGRTPGTRVQEVGCRDTATAHCHLRLPAKPACAQMWQGRGAGTCTQVMTRVRGQGFGAVQLLFRGGLQLVCAARTQVVHIKPAPCPL